MRRKVARTLSEFIVAKPVAVAVFLAVLSALAAWRASQLHINHNQIDLIPQSLPAVVATKEMIEIVGGVGFLLIPLKGKDLNHVKQVADELAPKLQALPEIKKVTYKQDVDWVADRIGLYVKTDDLQEASKRIRRKVRSILAKHNPFHISLGVDEEVALDLSDLVEKYRRMNKKAVDDPYYVDINKEAVLLVIKPSGENTDLAFIRRLIAAVDRTLLEYTQNNSAGAVLKEHYDGFAPGATVTYGYTGGYKRSLDDSDTIKAAVVPTSIVAFVGILIYLFWVLRRPAHVLVLMGLLGLSVTLGFAACEPILGELNTITAILGAILMGMGIDFGIHFMFRLREEYTRRGDLAEAIHQTIEHSGSASLGSAVTTAAAMFLLMLSDFRGFSDFGLITGVGVLLTFVFMYTATPVVYLVFDRFWPGFKDNLRVTSKGPTDEQLQQRPYPRARLVLVGSIVLTVGLALAATKVRFDYDSRAILTVNRPSLKLQDEITQRWKVSSDPVGIYTPTLEDARKLYDKLTPVAPDSNIDEVISIFTLLPNAEQQVANTQILGQLRQQASTLTKDMLDDPLLQKNFDRFMRILEAQPFRLEDIPEHISDQFRPAATSKYAGRGYLTFIYPKTSLWDGEELLAFAREVGTLQVDARTYHSAGMAVLFAQLAQIVLRDGVRVTLWSALAIFLIAWVNFRSIRGATLVMLPLVAGVAWMLGLMALNDWRINFMNIVVFPMVFGYGISSGVHLYHRYMESGSVMVAVQHTGQAIIASAVTTLIGWAAMFISDHRGLASMGVLACFGIGSSLVVSLTVLPSLLQVVHDRKRA